MKKRTGWDRQMTGHWAPATQLVRGGAIRSEFGESTEALFLTSGFCYDSAEQAEARFTGEDEGFAYSRQENPTVTALQEKLCLLEGAEACRATGTGMAAMYAALMCQLKAGDHVVAGRALFGSCRWLIDDLLPRYGIETSVVDGRDADAFAAAVRPHTRVFFLETPANPTLDIIDLEAVAGIGRAHDVRLVVDNVFATPLLQKPLALGADVVAYSTTKHIDGQGRCLGGAVLCSAGFDEEFLYPYYRHTGAAMSPFNAWVMLKALETLDLRVHRMCDTAEAVAAMLADRLSDVRHPALRGFQQHDLAMKQMSRGGTMVVFDMPGGKPQAFDFMNALNIIDISNNLGDSRSIITHPWTTTHKALDPDVRRGLGIGEGLLRLSVGLEDRDDLVNDLDRALAAAGL